MTTIVKCSSSIVYPPTGQTMWCDETPGHEDRHWHGNVSWRKGTSYQIKPKKTMPTKITLAPTERGFAKGEFTDIYGQKCSVQKSSLATSDAIWLGVDVGFMPEVLKEQTVINSPGTTGPTFPVGARMHLDRQRVRDLLPMLIKFAKTGELE